MVVKAAQIQMAKGGKTAQVVVLIGTGANRKSRTLHVRARNGVLEGANPFYSMEEITKKHQDVRATHRFALQEVTDARKHESNMLFIASERRPWLKVSEKDRELARTTWIELAEKATQEATKRLDLAFEELMKVDEEYPFTVTFESDRVLMAGKKPKPEYRRPAFA